jgi:hypothetical protein
MSRRILNSALIAAAVTLSSAAAVRSEEPAALPGSAPQTAPQAAPQAAPQIAPQPAPRDQSLTYGQTQNGVPLDGTPYGYNYSAAYPQIQAPLYPCPKPNIPYETGRTVITNPALAPHEMLYAHRYRALYPPYYYRNKCGLACLPFFPKPPLLGTQVTVKYKSGNCSWHPPCRTTFVTNRPWR